MSISFLLWTVLLFVMLYYPTHRMIYIMSVRRLEKRTDKQLDDGQVRGQKIRAHFITIILLTIFSALYNSYIGS